MKIEDLIALTKAGFTKEDIASFISGTPSTTSASPEEAAATTPAAAPAPEKAVQKTEEAAKNENQDISKIIEQKIGEAFKPFEELYNNIAIKANMPEIGKIEPKGIDDIINDFFTK